MKLVFSLVGRRGISSSLFTTLFMFVLAALAGCSVGPVDFSGLSGPTATPVYNGPTPTATPMPRALKGHIEDAYTGRPISGAEVTAGGVLTATMADGMYYFEDVPKGGKITAGAEGYSSTEVDTGFVEQLDVKLRPSTLTGKVTDSIDNKPLVGVLVKLVLPAAPAVATAVSTGLAVPPTQTITDTVTSFSYGGVLAAPEQASSLFLLASPTKRSEGSTSFSTATSTPRPPTATPVPVKTPPVGEGFVAVYTDQSGEYSFKDVPPGATLTFKMPGYKLTKMPIGDTIRKDVPLEQFKAQGIYITDNIAASKDLFDPLIDFVVNSRINAVVINVQSDASAWAFDVKNPDAIAAKNTDVYLKNLPEIVKSLREKGIYTIARVVTFQQKTMAEARPDWAVKSSVTGKPWKGGYAAQQRWLDASNPAAQDYMIAMTKEVLQLGFDEIQYDYIRFPSDPAPSEPGEMVFSRPLDNSTKPAALQEFLKKAHDTIEPTDAFMSIDVFGYTLWPDQTDGPILAVIGQVIETMIDYTDYVSPMIYPSHFSAGEQGCSSPAACAYKLIHKAGEYAEPRFAGKRAKYRPWLQDFDWGKVDYTSPGTTKVADQIRAAAETNSWGWLMWDPSNVYEPRAAFKKPK